MTAITEPHTTTIRADRLMPGMVRVWRGLHSGKVVQQAEIHDVEPSHNYVTVQYHGNATVSHVHKSVEVEVLAEGFEF